MKYYVVLHNEKTGKNMSLNYHGYKTKREAVAIANQVNALKEKENNGVSATVEKR